MGHKVFLQFPVRIYIVVAIQGALGVYQSLYVVESCFQAYMSVFYNKLFPSKWHDWWLGFEHFMVQEQAATSIWYPSKTWKSVPTLIFVAKWVFPNLSVTVVLSTPFLTIVSDQVFQLSLDCQLWHGMLNMHMHGILNKLDLAGSWIWFVI